MPHTTAKIVERLGEYIKAIGLLNTNHNFKEANLAELGQVAEALGCSNRRWRLDAGEEGRFVQQVGSHIAALARVFSDQKFLYIGRLARIATELEMDVQAGMKKADGDEKGEQVAAAPWACRWYTLDPEDQTPTEHCQNMSPQGCSTVSGTGHIGLNCGPGPDDCDPA